MIKFTCSACGGTIKASEDSAGQFAACPKCGESVAVPSPAGAAVKSYRDQENAFARPRKSVGRGDPAPSYIFLGVLIVLHMVLGSIVCLVGAVQMVAAAAPQGSATSFGAGALVLVAGLVVLGVGQGLCCLRDIARDTRRMATQQTS